MSTKHLALAFALSFLTLSAGDTTAPTAVPKKVEEVAAAFASSTSAVKAVVLMDGEEGKKLESIGGTYGSVYAFVTVLIYADFPDAKSDISTVMPRPSLFLISNNSPKGRVYFAKAESQPKKSKRSVKMGKMGMFGASGLGAPDADWTVEFAYEEMKPGIWKLTPKKDLVPGEYGIYLPAAMGLGATAAGEFYGFSVAKK